MTTVAGALQAAQELLLAAGTDDARLEAEVLLAFTLNIDRAHLLARLPDALDEDATRQLRAFLDRRAITHEPLAYIVGAREFYGLDFNCAPGALIPRPETELLVDIALAELHARGHGLRAVDVGTGTGAIAVAVALHAPEARLTAIDASDRALAIARANALHQFVAERISFRQGDLLDGTGEFDLILANLPYVSEGDWLALSPEIRNFEPREALVPGPSGIETTAGLLAAAPSHLAYGGLLAAEIGDAQAEALLRIARSRFPRAGLCVKKDLAGLDRVLTVRNGRTG